MKKDPLNKFIKNIQKIWGPLDSSLIALCQMLLEELLADLDLTSEDIRENRILYQDPTHGFMLLAHTEEKNLYRPPHDHGDGWVIYGVKSGDIEMGSYKQLSDTQLVRRNIEILSEGESRIYLPGDIHDTKCLSDAVLMLRLTSCDLEIEKQQGRMNIY